MFYYTIAAAIVGFATTVLGFFMLGWKDLKGLMSGGPYVVFGLLSLPIARHVAEVSRGWSSLIYVVGISSLVFGLVVLSQESRSKMLFAARYFMAGVFWLVMAVMIPDVTSSMRIFPLLLGGSYISIALATVNTKRLTGSYVGFDIALNGMSFLFLGILLGTVPNFFTLVGPSIAVP